jgi:multiple sugar transport system permease protein
VSTAEGRSRLGRTGFWAAIAVLTIVFVAPLLWMVSTSLKTNPDATRQPPSWIPKPFTTSGYEPLTNLSSQTPVVRWFVNSILAATGNAALIVVTASLAAYALARLDFPGKKLIFGMIVGTLFIPAFLFLVPNYLIIAKFGWLDSLWALILPTAGGAFGVFFLRQVFLSLPRELEEAALLDGANQFQIFMRVVVPLARPALATLIVLSFLTNWNDFLWPVYVLFSPANFTLPAGLSILQGAYTTNYPVIMAGAVVASVPVVVLFIAAQRHVVESVARSGLKG